MRRSRLATAFGGAALASARQVFLDDANARIVYKDGEERREGDDFYNVWRLFHADGKELDSNSFPPDEVYNQTLHSTEGPDTSCELVFQGASIAVFAILQPGQLGCLAFVSVDDSKEEIVNFTSPTAGSLPGARIYFKDGFDAAKDHTFRLRYAFEESLQARLAGALALDYFVIDDGTDLVASASSTESGTSTPGPSSTTSGTRSQQETGSGPPSSPSPQSTGQQSRGSGSAFKDSPAAIFGAVAGSLALVALCAFLGFRWWKRRRASEVSPFTPAPASFATPSVASVQPSSLATGTGTSSYAPVMHTKRNAPPPAYSEGGFS
ncbi:hypothetical protein AURDEDRAFT_110189 [Auricularia subglabra TFB-10046 SS5]|nr:hypothetical protein AURDEDRAFT_110189 [Auricularia subglabra TFB-10046 SS5]